MGRQRLCGGWLYSFPSFGNQIKNTEAEGHANIFVDGTLNLSTPGGNLNFDNGTGAGSHYWHIGLNGMINLANTTTVTKNDRTWNVEVVVSSGGDLGLTNRTLKNDALLTRKFMTTGGDLGELLDTLRIWMQTGDDAYDALIRVNSLDQLGTGNFILVSNGSGMSVQYKGTGYDAATSRGTRPTERGPIRERAGTRRVTPARRIPPS